MDAWKVYPHKNVEMGVGEEEKITLTGEAILAMKLESGSGLIYWTGKNYKWYSKVIESMRAQRCRVPYALHKV